MSASNELKSVFTQYWQFMALRAGCQVGLFDKLAEMPTPIDSHALAVKLSLHPHSLQLLMEALAAYGALEKMADGLFQLAEKGALLTTNHPGSLKNACLLWGEEHLDAWRNLSASLQQGKPAFDLTFGEGFFQYLESRSHVLENYHLAMSEYARDDYAELSSVVDFSRFQAVADVGGGTGQLTRMLAEAWPSTRFILFDKPEVLDRTFVGGLPNVELISGDFFRNMPFTADAILLARVLHDWPDKEATAILQNCHHSLPEKGQIFILEILNDEMPTPALNLHLSLVCGSRERTIDEYEALLSETGFLILSKQRLNNLQSILIAEKKWT